MHRVFLSSTARDLTVYRDAVADAIHRLDGFRCVRMEDFGARDAQADDFCQKKIAECEVAVFIIGLCYGSNPKGSKESYTHREYLAAKKAGKPILVWLILGFEDVISLNFVHPGAVPHVPPQQPPR